MSAPEVLLHGRSQPSRVELGEGSIWDERVQCLYWIDILGKRLHRYTPSPDQSNNGNHECWSLPSKPGCVVPTTDVNKLLLACEDGCYWFDLSTQTASHTQWPDVESHLDENRANDGKCDPKGRFLYGTMCMDESERGKERGSLYSVDSQGKHTTLLTNISISNGLGWSCDSTLFWHTDTPSGVIRQWHYDAEQGTIDIASERIAVKVPGNPDGFTVDANDHLVVAIWGSSKVVVYDPQTGSEVKSVELPNVTRVSSCAFGGRDLTDLYITTAAPGEKFEYTNEEENAGSLFVIRNFGKGRCSNKFAL